MSLYKRGGVYWYNFIWNGKHVQASTKQGNQNVARQIEAAHRTTLAKGEVGIKPKKKVPSLSQFVPEVMAEIKQKSSEHPRTLDFYEDVFNRVLGYTPIANAKLTEINPELLARFSTRQLGEVAPATVNRCLAGIRRAMYLAYEWELIDRVPKFKMLDGEREREFVLSGELREEFIAGLLEPCQTVARFLVDTGLRISECCALTWDRVFLSEDDSPSYVFINKGKSKKAKRCIPLTDAACQILEDQKKLSKSEFVFVRYGPRVKRELCFVAPISRYTVSEQFSGRRDEMDLPWDAVLHSTRHTALTDLGASGADAFTIREMAGHANVTTSQRYVHPVPETVARAVQKLNEFRKKPTTVSTTVRRPKK